jgi:energy-coupling factor transporter transmembrane protein EcfT
VLAIRHGDRKALAMDARAFGSVPRSAYRVVVWGPYDVWIALVGLFVAWAVLVIGR